MSRKVKIYRSENVNRENSDKINDNMWHAFKYRLVPGKRNKAAERLLKRFVSN